MDRWIVDLCKLQNTDGLNNTEYEDEVQQTC